ncbi:hypothetical protein [Oleispirillum naphthae]|uniref:hypothetical protein n=1 Tax=Oleispirillum naphthae TaxID=2838853 RepID=UPI0030824889
MTGASAGGTMSAAEMAARLEGTNISPQTFLATDYLNHFNEVVMLLGMLGDMPEMFEDVAAWAPKSYADHFRDSNFSDRDLAIAAYEMAPARYRRPFDDTIAQAERVVARSVAEIGCAIDAGETGRAALLGESASRILQKLIDVASGIIHGSEKGMSQAEVDAFIGGP